MNWKISGRNRKKGGEAYVSPDAIGIRIREQELSGDGSASSPRKLELEIANPGQEKWEGVLRFELYFEKREPQFFMPAFMYGRNRGETAANHLWQYPRLREGEIRMPYSPWWMVRSDRLSHPVSLAWDSGKVYGVSASPWFVADGSRKCQWMPGVEGTFVQYAGFGCSLEDGYVAYTIGYENAPVLFEHSRSIRERAPLGENCFCLEPGEKIQVTLQLYEYESEEPAGIASAIKNVYETFHQKPREGSTARQTVEDLAGAITQDAWREEERNYATQVYMDKNGKMRYNDLFSISWTGGVETAVPILLAGLRLSSEEMREQAISCIQNVVDHSMNACSGLPFDSYSNQVWSVNGWWREHQHVNGHAAYLAGQAVFYILKAWDYEKRLKGEEHPDWLDFAGKVIEKMETTKNGDQEYPYIWSEKTGAGLEYDSLSGVWCLADAAYYGWLTGTGKWLESLKKSEEHYFDSYVRKMECYGTPLDTDKAVDSEGILGYLKALHYLHAATGEERYLDHMKTAFDYEFSFKFCYNSPVKVPPLSRLGWSSCGGSVTSTCNPHIHPMSNHVVDEMLYYLRFRKDVYVESRLKDTISWGCQTYNTFAGEYDFGKKGWMSERFCHSEGLLIEKYEDGSPSSTWFALLPWGASNIIEGITGDYWEWSGQEERR